MALDQITLVEAKAMVGLPSGDTCVGKAALGHVEARTLEVSASGGQLELGELDVSAALASSIAGSYLQCARRRGVARPPHFRTCID